LGDLDGLVRQLGRHVRHLQRRAGRGYLPAGRRLRAGLPAASGCAARRAAAAAELGGQRAPAAQLDDRSAGCASRTRAFAARSEARGTHARARAAQPRLGLSAGDVRSMMIPAEASAAAAPPISRELAASGTAGPTLRWQVTRDEIPTLWTDAAHLPALLR